MRALLTALLLLSAVVAAQDTIDVRVSWAPPTQRVNGSFFGESLVSGWRVVYDCDTLTGSWTEIVTNPSARSHLLTVPRSDTCRFRVGACDTNDLCGVLSDFTLLSTSVNAPAAPEGVTAVAVGQEQTFTDLIAACENDPKCGVAGNVIAQQVGVVRGADTFTSLAIDPPAFSSILLAAIAIDKDSGTVTLPEGFSPIYQTFGVDVSQIIAYKFADGDEVSIDWVWANSRSSNAWVVELDGLTSVDVSATANSGSLATDSQTSGTTDMVTNADSYAVAVFSSDTGAVTSSQSYSNGFTGLYSENGDIGQPGLYVAYKNLDVMAAVEATMMTSNPDQLVGAIVVFNR